MRKATSAFTTHHSRAAIMPQPCIRVSSSQRFYCYAVAALNTVVTCEGVGAVALLANVTQANNMEM
jgi:hypothetical protein